MKHNIALIALIVLAILLVCPARAQQPSPLASLRPAHPRLLVLDSDLARVNTLLATDPRAQAIYANLKKEGERMIAQPPVEYKLIGPRLLDKSRTALLRISTLAALYRLDHDPRWIARARQEIAAVDAFQDWHPPHFLDTAEMTTAVAIGYDWLYPSLTTDERIAIRTAIVEKGLKPGLQAYHGEGPAAWWPKVSHNWNLVCNGGMLIGALAVAEDEPAIAAKIVQDARASMPTALATYAPDGGWPEGPGYWEYATRYAVLAFASLNTALGTDFGLSDSPGFSQTGLYNVYMTGPTGRSFNFADAHDGVKPVAECNWLAARYRNPLLAWSPIPMRKDPNPLSLLWYTPSDTTPASTNLPLTSLFHAVNVATARSNWDANATYVAFKGGDNKANHSHLDLGSFVLDAIGERWVMLAGPDDYNLPGYFGKERFTYYRTGTNGQNTLIINGQNQSPKADALITKYQTVPQPFAEANLTKAYAGLASQVTRSVQIVGGGDGVLVQDSISAPSPVSVRWQVHTEATIATDGASAVLTRHGKQYYAKILQPEGAAFKIVSAEQVPPQNVNKGISVLAIDLDGITETQISVMFSARPDLAQ